MHHDIVLEKLIFDLLAPRVRGGGGKISATMVLHFVIPFDLICKMTMFGES